MKKKINKVEFTEGFINDWERLFSNSPKYALIRAWAWIAHGVWRDIKSFYQRGVRGYSDVDVWDLGYYVASWMPEAIRKLKDDNGCMAGCPSGLKSRKEWEKILEQMAKGFEAVNARAEFPPIKRYEKLDKIMKTGLSLFAEWIEALWN